MTKITSSTSVNTPRPEHPTPQFQRDSWENLNGQWDFRLDLSASGFDQQWYKNPSFNKTILVPFCPESKLSGIEYTDFIAACWYHKTINITKELGTKTILHFGAVDYESFIYINEQLAGTHKGGYSSFEVDITPYITDGENDIVVGVKDDVRSMKQPGGKQSDKYYSYDCMYTRTTGIWQTVWLETIPDIHIESVKFIPNIGSQSVTVETKTNGIGALSIDVFFNQKLCGHLSTQTTAPYSAVTIPLEELHLWEPGVGNLYDVNLSFEKDTVHSYFGMREVRLDGYKFLINGKSVFQRLVLDQGFYPDGIYTASSEDELIRDIHISMEAGFNGARLHEKAFEPRFLYHCDRLGYLVWGEMANWGMDISDSSNYSSFIPEWISLVARDINHPAIVGWCPFNETWDIQGRQQDDELLRVTYQVTKSLDPSRPCIDTSGHFHVVTDIYDIHDYDQNPDSFEKRYIDFADGKDTFDDIHKDRQQYPGHIPFFISEYGGIKWVPDSSDEKPSWGYGDEAKTEEEFISRYRKLTEILIKNSNMFGFCYTQLYDVEQECNGLYSYQRKPKVDIHAIAQINTQKAAIEMY